MSDENLKLVETCALLILLQVGQEIANADLKNERGLELKRDSRERLVKLGLVDVRKEGQRIFLGLSDGGWNRALTIIGSEPPARSGYAGATIYAQVDALRNYLHASGLALSDFYVPPQGEPEPAPETVVELTTDDIIAQIRKAYGAIAQAPGDAVKLLRIRTALPDIGTAELDEALTVMNRADDALIFAEANQKTLTAADRAAAVTIGNQDKHLIILK